MLLYETITTCGLELRNIDEMIMLLMRNKKSTLRQKFFFFSDYKSSLKSTSILLEFIGKTLEMFLKYKLLSLKYRNVS